MPSACAKASIQRWASIASTVFGNSSVSATTSEHSATGRIEPRLARPGPQHSPIGLIPSDVLSLPFSTTIHRFGDGQDAFGYLSIVRCFIVQAAGEESAARTDEVNRERPSGVR